MDLYAAIDVRDGRCVRLTQGDFARQTTYDGDPVEVAAGFASAGAPWVHVVDLDAARTGRPVNREVVAALAAAVAVPVQAGGGMRSADAARALFDAGVARVVLGTAAVEQPDLVEDLAAAGHRVAVGLDVRAGQVAVRGWQAAGGVGLAQMLDRFAGCGAEAAVVTCIERDGMLAGPDLTGLAEALGGSALPIVASGGVSSLDDLRALTRLEACGRRLAGVVVGKALHDGRFDVTEAVAALSGRGAG
jgi:phosphoribosylformimino-5-aminoimidazole carboxamide ribotide isomerase